MSVVRAERTVRSFAVTGEVAVTVATLRLTTARGDTGGHGAGFELAMSTPLAVQGGGRRPIPVPRAAWRPSGLLAALICRGASAPAGEETHMEDQEDGAVLPALSRAGEIAGALAAAGSGQGVVGEAIRAGDRVVVPLLETMFSGGYGGGSGDDPSDGSSGMGGGGGGFGRSRTVAVLEVTPQSVQIRPVVDTTAIVLAAIGAGLGLARVLRRTR